MRTIVCWGFVLSAWVLLAEGVLITYTGSQSLNEGTWFIMFHVAWCKHCTDVKPEFTAAAFSSALRFLTLDCVKYNDLCHAFGLTSFPSFMYVSEGQKTLYEGNYRKRAFEDYARKVTSPALTIIAPEEWEEKVSSHSLTFTLTYNPETDAPFLHMFERTAERFKSAPLFFYAAPWSETKVISTSREGSDQYELTNLSERSISEFVSLHKQPVLVEVASDHFLIFKHSLRQKLLIILVLDTHDLDNKYRIAHFYAEARKYRLARNTEVQFCFIDVSAPDTDLELLSFSSLPAVAVLRLAGEVPEHSVLTEPTEDSVHAFLEQVVEGDQKLEPLHPGLKYYVKSFQRWLSEEGSDIDFTCMVLVLLLVLVCCGYIGYKKCSRRPKSD